METTTNKKSNDKWRRVVLDITKTKRSEKPKGKTIKVLSKYGTFLHGLICLIATLYLIYISLVHYLANNDTSFITTTEFNFRPMDTYPTYTICLVDIRQEWETLGIHGRATSDGIFQSWYIQNIQGVKWPWYLLSSRPWHKYRNFLKGKNEHNKMSENKKIKERQVMSQIDFIKATKPLANFMENMEVVETFNSETRKTLIERYKKGNRSAFESMLYLSDQSPNQLCYTRKSTNGTGYKKIKEKLKFQGSDVYSRDLSSLFVYVHHPGQFHRKKTQVAMIELWKSAIGGGIRLDNHNHNIEIASTDILRKRKDSNKQCNNEIDSVDDEHWIKSAVVILNCIPPFWKAFYAWQNSTFSTCKTSEQFQMYDTLLNNPSERDKILDGYKQPCAEMTNTVTKSEFFDTDVTEKDQVQYQRGNLSIIINYPEDKYHEIINMQQITFDSFWSSTGGFVGMFLGYSLMQVPQFVFGIVMWYADKKH